MVITARQLLANLSASIISLRRTQAQRVAAEDAAKIAKEQRDSTEADEAQAVEEVSAKHPDGDWPKADCKRVSALISDRQRAKDKFELADRQRRKLVAMDTDQTEAFLALADEALGEKQRDINFGGDAEDDSVPFWHAVALKALLGPMHAAPFEKAGISTVIQAVKAIEGDQIKAMLREEEITKAQADMLQSYVARYLSDRSIDHNLGKPRKLEELPDIPKAKKEEAPAGPAVDAIKLVELSNPVWDEACRHKCTLDAENAIVGTVRPWKPFDLGGGVLFFVLQDQPEFNQLVGVHVYPRSDWEKANPDKKPAMALAESGDHIYDGLLVASDAGELVCGKTVRFALATNKKAKDIPAAPATPGKKKHKPVHVKGKGAKAAVRRKAEANV